MAKLSIRSNKRGRPLSIDPEKELNDLMFSLIPKAQKNLTRFRRETSGVRDPSLLGTETTLPAFIQTSLDILYDITEGQSIDYGTLKELRKNIRTIKELASPQSRVYNRALEPQLTQEYISSLDFATRNSNEFVRESNQSVKNKLLSLSASQRQKFFLSRNYQDPKTQTSNYQRIIAWASGHVGRQVSLEEAWAILRGDAIDQFIETQNIF